MKKLHNSQTLIWHKPLSALSQLWRRKLAFLPHACIFHHRALDDTYFSVLNICCKNNIAELQNLDFLFSKFWFQWECIKEKVPMGIKREPEIKRVSERTTLALQIETFLKSRHQKLIRKSKQIIWLLQWWHKNYSNKQQHTSHCNANPPTKLWSHRQKIFIFRCLLCSNNIEEDAKIKKRQSC